MRIAKQYPVYILFVILALLGSNAFGQTNEQKALETRREQLQKEIEDINRLLFAEKKQKGTVLDQMQVLDQKINVRQQLIRVTGLHKTAQRRAPKLLLFADEGLGEIHLAPP